MTRPSDRAIAAAFREFVEDEAPWGNVSFGYMSERIIDRATELDAAGAGPWPDVMRIARNVGLRELMHGVSAKDAEAALSRFLDAYIPGTRSPVESAGSIYTVEEVAEAMEVLRGRHGSTALLPEVLDDMERAMLAAAQAPAAGGGGND